MPKPHLKKRKSKINENFSDNDLLMLIAIIINQNPKYQNLQKGVWIWNRTDKRFVCSAGFRDLMGIGVLAIPDLDFWFDKLAPDDFIIFTETLDGVIQDSQPHNCIFKITSQDSEKRIIQCFMESMASSHCRNYIIGVFYDISERIFSECRN